MQSPIRPPYLNKRGISTGNRVTDAELEVPQQPRKARIGLPNPVPRREYDQGHRRVAHRDCDGVTGAQGLETRRPLLPIARRGIGPENGGAFPHELVDLSRR